MNYLNNIPFQSKKKTEAIKDIVKSINGITPDSNGNIIFDGGDGVNVGDITQLPTVDKSNVVNAIKEHAKEISVLSKITSITGERLVPEMYDNERIKRAIDKVSLTGGSVLLPKGEYEINPSVKILVPSNIRLVGEGMGSTVLKSSVSRTVKMIEIQGSYVSIENLCLDLCEYDTTSNLTAISHVEMNGNVSNIQILNCNFKNGYAGVWLNPINKQVIHDITIQNCVFSKLRHSIYIGIDSSDAVNRTDRIFDIIITGNTIKDGLNQSDGIKTTQRCDSLTITNNVITNQTRDAVDLFASGNNVTISNNIFRGNSEVGIDIKRSTLLYPEAILGASKKMIITNNLIDENTTGISIAQIDGSLDDNYLIILSNNSISKNLKDGLRISANYVNCANNMFFENCSRTDAPYTAIRLEGSVDKIIKGINVIGNQIINNGNAASETTGLRMTGYVEDSNIIGNVISNSTKLDNPNQKIGLYITDANKNITVRDNKISGHIRDVWIKNGADVHGESLYIPIGDIAKSSFTKYLVGIQVKSKVSYVDVKFINGADIVIPDGVDTGYLAFRVIKITNGVFSSTLAYLDTTTTGINAYKPKLINAFSGTDISTDTKKLEVDEVMALKIDGGNGGKAITNGSIEIRYIKY